MTIKKGEPWGQPGPLPQSGVVVYSDAEAREVVEDARLGASPIPPLGLLGGDLCRTVGGRGDEARLRSEDAVHMPVDLGWVLIDGRPHWFVSHLIARHSWWKGRVVAVMNSQWVGDWDVAPRSHPNDGMLHVFDSDLSLNDRLKARSRLRTGTHVPHKGIVEKRITHCQIALGKPTPVWLDGVEVAMAARHLTIRIEPDALLCVV